ncbi:hypothetical protein EDB86DRAFT_3248313 [Lactarius hatsudake]|nr:hypothetical protein EDB86DRAFT_3248313 [Lactarius hatsudake]
MGRRRPGRRPAFVWAQGVQSRLEIYKSPAFSFSSHLELSVSQLSSKYPDRWRCGKVVLYGYGLQYLTRSVTTISGGQTRVLKLACLANATAARGTWGT